MVRLRIGLVFWSNRRNNEELMTHLKVHQNARIHYVDGQTVISTDCIGSGWLRMSITTLNKRKTPYKNIFPMHGKLLGWDDTSPMAEILWNVERDLNIWRRWVAMYLCVTQPTRPYEDVSNWPRSLTSFIIPSSSEGVPNQLYLYVCVPRAFCFIWMSTRYGFSRALSGLLSTRRLLCCVQTLRPQFP